ncbi:glucuronyl hydrolase, partial [Streptococcus suis]|nr:glucuronyl hydrolase [Streptococcus suis]
MIKDVLIESIAKKREFRNSTLLSKKEVVAAIELAIQQLVINCEYFG